MLQKQMYKDRNYPKDEGNDESVYYYVQKMRLESSIDYIPEEKNDKGYPSLKEIIKEDPHLKYIYDDSS